ncbi:hypothetical protein ACXZ1M_24270 [Duganella sp. PWIR1]
MANAEIVRVMRGLKSGWSASAWWLKIAIVIVVYLVIRAVFNSFTDSPEPAKLTQAAPASAPAVVKDDTEEVARHSCWDAIIARATNKSSVDFHSFSYPPRFRKLPNGRVEVLVKFSAKNGFGAESTSIARCLFESDGKTLIDLEATDSR